MSRAGMTSMALLFGAVLAWSPGARASGGDSDACDASYRIDMVRFSTCDGSGALLPSNDTRANLALLLFDRHSLPARRPPADSPPFLSWTDFRDGFLGAPEDVGLDATGEGSRCMTDQAGAAGFEAAVRDAQGIPPDERAALTAVRSAYHPNCQTRPGAVARAADLGPVQDGLAKVTSAAGRPFAAYVEGVRAFYGGSFEGADARFGAAMASSDPWLSDAASYMVVRTRVNRLQVGVFDDYGTFKGSTSVDPDVARSAEAACDAYLRAHPEGRWTASAQGLMRRVEWLAGWDDRLAYRLSSLLALPPDARRTGDEALVGEVDSKLLPTLRPSMTTDPLLLAVLDLEDMRKVEGEHSHAPTRPDLEAQRDAFASMPALYGYIRAASALFVDGDAAAVMRDIPDDARRRDGDYLWFSRQFLRGQALERAGDRNAAGFWRDLLPGATRPLDAAMVQLAMALYDERHGRLADVFAPGSPVTDPAMRIVLLDHDAGPDLLRAQAMSASVTQGERSGAGFDLLAKEVTRGGYADYLSDVASLPYVPPERPSSWPGDTPWTPQPDPFTQGKTWGDVGCPTLDVTASRLARGPGSPRDRLCLAEWVRLNGLDVPPQDVPPPSTDLGGSPSEFPGKPYARMATYQSVMADASASDDDRAFALYRAVRCYEPSGNNGCGGPEVPKRVRRRWYDALRRDHGSSRWARELRFWW